MSCVSRTIRLMAAGIIALTSATSVAVAEAEATTEPCTLQGGATRSVVRVIDSETVLLDDHEEVRLIGALSPRSPDLAPNAAPWREEDAAIEALRALVQNRSVSLATAGREQDRYGRKLAHLFVDKDGDRQWVQGELLKSGHARVYGLPGNYACMHELLAHEHFARSAGTGLWANAAYALRSARATRDLLRRRNSYEIVVGEVRKVAITKSRTYLNFGADWRSDFTAGIESKVLRANPQWAQDLSQLEGKRVEVRGWIQYRNGPYIDIEDPSQLAPADDTLPGPTMPPSDAMTSSGRKENPANGELNKEDRPAPEAPGDLDL